MLGPLGPHGAYGADSVACFGLRALLEPKVEMESIKGGWLVALVRDLGPSGWHAEEPATERWPVDL